MASTSSSSSSSSIDSSSSFDNFYYIDGFGSNEVNGRYEYNGDNEGKKSYKKVGEDYWLIWYSSYDRWVIDSIPGFLYWQTNVDNALPDCPPTSWEPLSGTYPIGTITLNGQEQSSSSSSSSSLGYSSSSSSSSSSYLDYDGDGTLEFNYGDSNIKPVWKMVYGTEHIYAGTGDGKILRSSNGFHWEEFYQTDDINISAMYIFDNKIYIGTSPHGIIYIIDLITLQVLFSQSLTGEISNFFDMNNRVYATTNNPSNVYCYNQITKIWDFYYKPYGNRVNEVVKMSNQLTGITNQVLFFMNTNQVISFNGDSFKLVKIS